MQVGAVNFNVLHTLLHALINELGLRGAEAALSQEDREFLSTTGGSLQQAGGTPDSGLGSTSAGANSFCVVLQKKAATGSEMSDLTALKLIELLMFFC